MKAGRNEVSFRFPSLPLLPSKLHPPASLPRSFLHPPSNNDARRTFSLALERRTTKPRRKQRTAPPRLARRPSPPSPFSALPLSLPSSPLTSLSSHVQILQREGIPSSSYYHRRSHRSRDDHRSSREGSLNSLSSLWSSSSLASTEQASKVPIPPLDGRDSIIIITSAVSILLELRSR